MSIDKLKEMEREAARLRSEQSDSQRASERLAKLRNSTATLWEQMDTLRSRWNYGADAVAQNALVDVINELKVDIYRIAELRLQAKAREMGVKAAQRSAVIQSCILPVPELKMAIEESSHG